MYTCNESVIGDDEEHFRLQIRTSVCTLLIAAVRNIRPSQWITGHRLGTIGIRIIRTLIFPDLLLLSPKFCVFVIHIE
jgi:hypothetical protein